MKVELPDFKRCCCCLPLRRGLLTWGYIKLVIINVLLVVYFTCLVIYFIRYYRFTGILSSDFILCLIIVLLFVMDTAFTILFLVGGHQRSARLLKIFYIYSIVFTALSTLLLLGTSLLKIIEDARPTSGEDLVYTNFAIYSSVLSTFLDIALQVYFVLLIRSEMKKLENSCNFRFDNTEAQCSMEMPLERNIDEICQ